MHIEFAAGSSDHVFHVKQQANQLVGTHQGDFTARDFTGSISGSDVRIASNIGEVHGAALSYTFTGKAGRRQNVGRAEHGRIPGREVDRNPARVRPRSGRRRMRLPATFLLAAFCAHGQFVLTKEQMVAYTADNPYERFADGRPKVPDDLLER